MRVGRVREDLVGPLEFHVLPAQHVTQAQLPAGCRIADPRSTPGTTERTSAVTVWPRPQPRPARPRDPPLPAPPPTPAAHRSRLLSRPARPLRQHVGNRTLRLNTTSPAPRRPTEAEPMFGGSRALRHRFTTSSTGPRSRVSGGRWTASGRQARRRRCAVPRAADTPCSRPGLPGGRDRPRRRCATTGLSPTSPANFPTAPSTTRWAAACPQAVPRSPERSSPPRSAHVQRPRGVAWFSHAA